jgi:hypothetical protein
MRFWFYPWYFHGIFCCPCQRVDSNDECCNICFLIWLRCRKSLSSNGQHLYGVWSSNPLQATWDIIWMFTGHHECSFYRCILLQFTKFQKFTYSNVADLSSDWNFICKLFSNSNTSKLISSYKHNPFGLLADVAKCNPLTTDMPSITSILIIATL